MSYCPTPLEMKIWKSEAGPMCVAKLHEGFKSLSSGFTMNDWWCGYVVIPVDHPFYRQGYGCWRDSEDHPEEVCTSCHIQDLNVHGGITFADFIGEDWCIGFDCNHFWDRHEPKDFEYVKAECEKLARQVKEHEK